MKKIKYDLKQVEATARYIFDNNYALLEHHTHVTKPEHIEMMIIDHMIQFAQYKEGTVDYSSTGGWLICATKDTSDSETIDCGVYCDLAINTESLFNYAKGH